MNATLKILIYLALAIILVTVGYWNSDQQVDVTYFPGRSLEGIPVFLVILGSVFVGVLIAGVVGVVEQIRHQMRERALQREIEALRSELRELRNLPINGGFLDDDEEPAWTPPAE